MEVSGVLEQGVELRCTFDGMAIEDHHISQALAKLRGHKDNAVQDAFSGLAHRLDSLVTEVRKLADEVAKHKGGHSQDSS